jgi:hypothetical protein
MVQNYVLIFWTIFCRVVFGAAKLVPSTKRTSSRSTTLTRVDPQHRPEVDLRPLRKDPSTAAFKTRATGKIRPGIKNNNVKMF